MPDIKQALYDYSTASRILPETTYDQVLSTNAEDETPVTLAADLAAIKESIDTSASNITTITNNIEQITEEVSSVPKIIVGTDDLEDGVSALDTGTLYVVY